MAYHTQKNYSFFGGFMKHTCRLGGPTLQMNITQLIWV